MYDKVEWCLQVGLSVSRLQTGQPGQTGDVTATHQLVLVHAVRPTSQHHIDFVAVPLHMLIQ